MYICFKGKIFIIFILDIVGIIFERQLGVGRLGILCKPHLRHCCLAVNHMPMLKYNDQLCVIFSHNLVTYKTITEHLIMSRNQIT